MSPEMINKLVQDTHKQIGGNNSAPITIGDFNKMLSILEALAKTLDKWTEDNVDDYVKSVREVIGVGKKNSLIDELDAANKKEKKEEKDTSDKRMSQFAKDLKEQLGSVFKDAAGELYEKTIKSAAEGITELYADISTDIKIAFSGLKDFVVDGLSKFGGSFRKLLTLDFKGAFLDMFSLVKTTFVALLKLPLKILGGIFWSISKIAGVLVGVVKFMFGFIWNSIKIIMTTALKISWYITKFVLKVAYKILSTVASVAFNVIGYMAKTFLGPIMFIAGAIGILLLSIWVIQGGLKKFFANDSSGAFGSVGSFFSKIGTFIAKEFTALFTKGSVFFNFLNRWWTDIWEGETLKISGPKLTTDKDGKYGIGWGEYDTGGFRSGGLKGEVDKIFGKTIKALYFWWYGTDTQGTFGAGGASAALKKWWLGDDGTGGVLGTIKDSIFGEGSSGLTFVEILKMTFNPMFSYILNVMGSVLRVMSRILPIIPIVGAELGTKTNDLAGSLNTYADTLGGETKALTAKKVAFAFNETLPKTGPLSLMRIDPNQTQLISINDTNAKNIKIQGLVGKFMEVYWRSEWLRQSRGGKNDNLAEAFINDHASKRGTGVEWLNALGYVGDNTEFISALFTNDSVRKAVTARYDNDKDIKNYHNMYGTKSKAYGQESLEDVATSLGGNGAQFLEIYKEYYKKSLNREWNHPKGKSEWAFALGGIVTGPTRALIGEAKTPEMVIPLDDRGINFVHETMSKLEPESSESKWVSSKLEQIINLVKRTGVSHSAPSSVPSQNTGMSMSDMVSKGQLDYRK